jgi:hypothetical protein
LETDMENMDFPDEAIQAYLKLIELNMASWKPDVSEWLHSSEAELPLRQLLANVPCSATIH